MPLQIRNPHSVLAALERRPKDVLRIEISPAAKSDAWEAVAELAREHRIPISGGEPAGRSGGRGDKARGRPNDNAQLVGGRTGAAMATIKEAAPISVESLFENAKSKAGGRGVWIALDSLQDPHNLGAIFRTAAFFGAQGILLTQERSAPLTETVYDVASGGVESLPFAMITNLQHGFDIAKEAGLWILGTSEHASDTYAKQAADRPWLIVLGNEEKGMRRLTSEACDVTVAIPPLGEVKSLNVSVAAGVLISHFAKK